MSPLALSLRFLQAQPDSRLVELARQGHEPAFEALVRRYRKELLSYCRRLQPQSGNAEDALQQTLLYAWRALNNGGQVRDVRPWLYRIAHNVSLNNLRVTVAVPQEILDTPGDQDVDRLVEQRLRARAALACMASLPALQRQAFISTVLDGASHDDVATALGLSNGAVRGLIYRARAIVRAAAAAITPGPVISWAIQRAETGSGSAPAVAEAIAGGGGAGVAAVIAKGGAVLTLAVAGAGGVVLSHPGGHHGRARPQIARSSGLGQTASRPAASAHVAGGLPAEIGHGVNSGRTSDTTSRVATGRASARIREDNSRGERHGGSSGRTTGGHDGGARGESHGGRSSATSGSSDGGSASGATIAVPGSGHGDGGSSGSSGGSDGGSGSDGTSALTTSGSNGGTSGGPGPSSGGQLTTAQATSDGGTGSDGGSSGDSSASSGSGDTVTTISPH